VLGYVNVDNQGLAGIERAFDRELSTKTEAPLKLSIDVKLQNILRDELLTQYELYKAKGAIGMIVDVRNGEIMAMVSLPDFDPNFANSAPADHKFNRATLGTYEMGSTMKPFTAAMALEYGTSNLDKTYSPAPLYLDGFTINDFHAIKHNVSLLQVMQYSSNVGTGRIALEVGTEKQKKFLENLDMFKKPEIEIPEKSRTIKPSQWGQLNGVTIAFGHGISITPVNLAKSYLPLFNGGHVYPVTLMKRNKSEVKEIRRVLTDKTVQDMRTIFRTIVVAGTGRGADAKGYLVGGKTGTAEKIENGQYSKNKVMSSFVGAFPTNNPKYLVIAIVDDPIDIGTGRPTGGKVAAPAVHNVVMRTGTILGIRPQKSDVTELKPGEKPKAPATTTPAADEPPAAETKPTQPETPPGPEHD
jgi:cell division protein FtsI (penicillin-binding protein 3)